MTATTTDHLLGALAPLAIPIDSVRPHPENPNVGDVGAIAASLASNRQYKPIVVQASTGYIIAGNHTWTAACQLEWPEIAAVRVDVTDDEARRILAVDNRTAELGQRDDALLAALLQRIVDGEDELGLHGTGYAEDDLAALVDALTEPGEITGDPDAVPMLPGDDTTISRKGDVWVLGPHRLACGDSTDPATAEALMRGARAHCMWTDPPYGIDYVGGYSHQYSPAERLAKGGATIRNDGEADLPALLTGFLQVATDVLRPGAAAYIAHPAGLLSTVFAAHITAAGWSLRQQLIWVKDSLVMGRSDYHYRHEPVWMAYTPGGKGRKGRGGPAWFGDDAQDSVFEIARPKRSEEHPTMKPVALVTAMLANSCPKGGTVYDAFGGSGTTLIAAHTLGISARVCELDPKYADVICGRYEAATGDVPVLESTGEPHSFTIG